jgi:signal transduction histidine kinase
VLSNYLTNALKFAPLAGPVQVSMVLEEATVRVRVQDRGPGLYICQQLIHRQHGEVGVESDPGKGATFWFALQVQSGLDSQ